MGSQSDRTGDLIEGGRERAICPHASIKEKPREDPATRRLGSLQASEGTVTGAWPCWHSDLGPAASKAMRKRTSVCGVLLQQPEH